MTIDSNNNYENFVLATGNILEFSIPDEIKKGHEYQVSVKVQGNGKYLFLTLLLVNPAKEQQWWADNNTVDLIKNGGKLELNNESYQDSWYFPIYSDAVTGHYIAFMGLYQDTYDLPTVNRRLVDYKIKTVEVIEDIFAESHVTKVLGIPYDKKDGIQTYKNRKTSPFEELLHEAKEEILFVSTSNEFVAKYHKTLIQELINKKIGVTVMVLDPASKEIESKESLFEITGIRDLSKVIIQSLKEMCFLKRKLREQEEKLIIKTYDSNVKYSYIVVDPHSENAIMKIEELPGDNPEIRKSYLAYQKDNQEFFQKHWKEINSIQNVENYNCNEFHLP